MRVQVTLTSSESKRLLGKAVSQMDVVKKALKKGTIIIPRCTTNAFVIEEITGRKMKKEAFVGGYIVPMPTGGIGFGQLSHLRGDVDIIVIKDGKVIDDMKASEVFSYDSSCLMARELGPDDVVIKSGNAIGPDRIAGVMCARGTLEQLRSGSRRSLGGFMPNTMIANVRGANLIIPIGLEKCIPISVLEASKETIQSGTDLSIGGCGPVSLIPIFGTVITEVEAVKIVSGAEAVPIGLEE